MRDPEERAAVEREVVQRYFEELALLVPDDAVRSMTSEECWAEYIDGGLGRWGDLTTRSMQREQLMRLS